MCQEKWLPARLGVVGQISKGPIACNVSFGMGYIELGLGASIETDLK